MPSNRDQSSRFERLRRQAEELVRQRPKPHGDKPSEVLELIHELEIHQAELEIQNEEMQRSRQEHSELHERYARLYELAPCGYLTLSPKGVISSINLTGVGLLGADRSDATRRSLGSFVVQGSQAGFYAALKEAAGSGGKQSRELRLQRDDGSLIWVHADIQADTAADGEPAEYQVTLVDITERKEAETELSLQARISQIFLSVSDEDMYAHVLDVIREVFDSPFGYFGYINREGDLVCPSMTKDIWERCRMEDKDIVFPQSAWGGLWGRSLREKATLGSNGPLSLPSGHVQFQRAMASAIVERGELVGQLALARHSQDYTEQEQRLLGRVADMVAPILSARLAAARREEERCRAEEALRRSEEKYRQLAEGTEAILWEYHIPSDCWTYVAPQAEKLLGYPPQEWTGLRFWVDHIHEEDRDWAKRYCLDCTSRGEPHTFEYRFLAKDGRVVWLRDVVSVEMDGGEPVRLRGFMVDITRSKELERLKEDVDRITRHDLKSPLNGIISMPQILMEEGNLSRKQREILRDIQGAGQRMLYMINMSLGLYQMEQGTYELEPKPVDLLPVLSEVERDLDNLRSGYEIALSLDVEGDAPRDNTAFFVLGERSLCYSMLSNLLKNAMEASPQGGSVRISLREGEQGRARIVVSNQGSIPVSLRERFGEKYATAGKRYGTGLGVYSARLIAETMNGTFSWTSSQEQGTSVYITLPLADDVS